MILILYTFLGVIIMSYQLHVVLCKLITYNNKYIMWSIKARKIFCLVFFLKNRFPSLSLLVFLSWPHWKPPNELLLVKLGHHPQPPHQHPLLALAGTRSCEDGDKGSLRGATNLIPPPPNKSVEKGGGHLIKGPLYLGVLP